MNNLYILLIIICIYIILNNRVLIQENFAGFHKVNTVIRYVRRCHDAINSLKFGIWNAVDKVVPNNHNEKCEQHHECSDKCVCEQKKCKCIPNV